MEIFVTTCKRYSHLVPNFSKLFKRFWGDEFTVIGTGKNLCYSHQLMRIVEMVKDTHFILLHEDFYLIKPIDRELLYEAIDYVEKNPEIARIGLQGIKEGYEDSVEQYDGIFWRLKEKHEYLCSFEASIFSKVFLEKYLRDDENPRETEINTSKRASGNNEIVLLTEEKIATYKDAMIGGNLRIESIDGEMWVQTPKGLVNQHIKL